MATILVVDDEKDITTLLEAMLGARGYEVVTFDRAEPALELIASDTPPDLLISDVRMDPIDGIELLRQAKEVQPDMPVIMVTAYRVPEAEQRAKELGAWVYLYKPFDVEGFAEAVAGALASASSPGKDA